MAVNNGTRTDGPTAGGRAPDAPTEGGTLFEDLAGPHFTVLGFGASAVRVTRDLVERHGSLTSTMADNAVARRIYGVDGDALVLIRPDNHIALITTLTAPDAIDHYLDRIGLSS